MPSRILGSIPARAARRLEGVAPGVVGLDTGSVTPRSRSDLASLSRALAAGPR
jgi:hypothetical protein